MNFKTISSFVPEIEKQKTETAETAPNDDLLDFLDWSDSGYSFDDVNAIVSNWNRLVNEKIPPLPFYELWAGKYQVYWGGLFARDALAAEEKLTNAIGLIADGELDISELKTIYCDWLIHRVSYYKQGAVIAQSDAEKANFKKRLTDFLKLPGEVSE